LPDPGPPSMYTTVTFVGSKTGDEFEDVKGGSGWRVGSGRPTEGMIGGMIDEDGGGSVVELGDVSRPSADIDRSS